MFPSPVPFSDAALSALKEADGGGGGGEGGLGGVCGMSVLLSLQKLFRKEGGTVGVGRPYWVTGVGELSLE